MYFDPISAGIGLIGSTIGAIGKENARRKQHEQQLKQTRLQNQQMMARYQQQLKIRNAQIKRSDAAYNLKKVQYDIASLNLDKQASMAYLAEEAQLNEIFKSAKFTQQSDNIAREKTAGKRAARNVTGNTAARGAALDMADYGRKEAARVENLFGQTFASDLRREKTNWDYNSQKLAAWASVSQPPIRTELPRAPVQLDAPAYQGGGMFAMDMLGGAVSAFGAGYAGGQQNRALKMRNPTA